MRGYIVKLFDNLASHARFSCVEWWAQSLPASSKTRRHQAVLCACVQIDVKRVAEGNVICCTAEQWDRLSRRWRQRRAVSDLSLFITDEIHLLGGESGPTLEVVVSRMRAVAKLLAKPIRFVGLGSSIADAKDVGDWMGAPAHAQFNFPPAARAVPLEIHIHSLDIASFEARLQARRGPIAFAVVVHSCMYSFQTLLPIRIYEQF
jgi:replicative superfamily II helicase